MSPRLARQLLLLGLGSSVWSVVAVPTLLAWVGAYAAVWVACELPPIRALIREARPNTLALLAAVLVVPGVAFGYRTRDGFIQREGLLGAMTRWEDRWRVTDLPAIAPPLWTIDRPQTWFVATAGARNLTLEVAGVRALKAESLGDGLFRVDYDPRRDGVPSEKSERVPVSLRYDDHKSERKVQLVRPLAHPRWFCVPPDRTRAVALSEETDELFVLSARGLESRQQVGDGPVDCAFVDATHVVVTHRYDRTLAIYDVATTQAAPIVRAPRNSTTSNSQARADHDSPPRVDSDSQATADRGSQPDAGQPPNAGSDALEGTADDRAARERSRTAVPAPASNSTARGSQTLTLPTRPGRLALSPSGSLLAVALDGERAEVAIVRVPELTITSTLALPCAADWLAFGPTDDLLFASTRSDAKLHRLRAHGDAFVDDGALELGRPVVTLARSSDGAQLWAATTDLHDSGHAQLGNHFVQDQLLTIDTATFSIAGQRFTAHRTARQTKPGDVDRGVSPMGIHPGRDGGLWVAFAGTDEVWQLESSRTIDLGDAGLYTPHGIAELADGTLLISSPTAGAFGVLAPGATEPRVVRVSPTDPWLLEHDRSTLARRVGERGFYEATRSGISCQSCHMHADSDDAAYNLGDHRLLPTLSVRGLADTAPYLRDGSYPRLRDLDDVAQTLYRGYPRNQASRGETIEAFVRALPRRDNPRGATARDLQAEQRGFAAFEKARCQTCHSPPAFTSLAQFPLRWLFPDQAAALENEETLDTPSLLSIRASAPYLNDGRAATLDAVLVAENSRNLHGDVSRLSDVERSDLITFLSSL